MGLLFDAKEMVLSLLEVFSFDCVAVNDSVLNKNSGFDLSSETITPKYFNLINVFRLMVDVFLPNQEEESMME